jgi:glutathione synthase
MRAVFVADPIPSLDPAVDTTLGLMSAALQWGAEVWATTVHDLEVIDGRPHAHAHAVAAGLTLDGDPQRLSLDGASAIFMRTDPPVDQSYLNATLVLDLVDAGRTAMVNDPRGLRAVNEKLWVLQFPELVPETVVSARRDTVRAFVDLHGTAVAKPIDGYAGRGVVRLSAGDPNLPSLVELLTDNGSRAVVVQRYLSEVTEGNKRIFVLDGQPVGAVYRFPAGGDFRIGNPAEAAPVTARDREICSRIGPALVQAGLRMVGLDVIGRHLIEVNVTSPGALRKADALLGWSLCRDLIEHVFTSGMRRTA